MSKDIIIKTIDDPDFGTITLVETHFTAAVGDGPMTELAFRSWVGEPGAGRPCKLQLITEADPPAVAEEMRACYRRTVATLDDLRSRVAASELQLARDWAEEGDLDIELDAAKLAGLLRLDAIEVSEGRLTLYYLEDMDIFAGHYVEVRLEPSGEIREIGLAG